MSAELILGSAFFAFFLFCMGKVASMRVVIRSLLEDEGVSMAQVTSVGSWFAGGIASVLIAMWLFSA